MSTYKLATGLVVFPLWAGALVGASFVLLPPPWSLVGAGLAVASPFAALAWLDELDRPRARRRRANVDLMHLRARRERVMRVLESARQRLDVTDATP
jgi:hypothetical protein